MQRLPVLLIFLLCFFGASAQSGIVSVQVKASELPKGIRYRGQLYEAWQWKDKLGDNFLVLSSTPPVKMGELDEAGTTVELFAGHFCKKDTGYRSLWRLNDLVRDCPLDYVAEFIKGATTVTDLDNDSVAETTLQYKLACRGDVSPSHMKLIMHEDSVKYALRGSMWIRNSEKATFKVTEQNANLEKRPRLREEDYEETFGRYESEKDFAKAPPGFLSYVRGQWVKFAKESD